MIWPLLDCIPVHLFSWPWQGHTTHCLTFPFPFPPTDRDGAQTHLSPLLSGLAGVSGHAECGCWRALWGRRGHRHTPQRIHYSGFLVQMGWCPLSPLTHDSFECPPLLQLQPRLEEKPTEEALLSILQYLKMVRVGRGKGCREKCPVWAGPHPIATGRSRGLTVDQRQMSVGAPFCPLGHSCSDASWVQGGGCGVGSAWEWGVWL